MISYHSLFHWLFTGEIGDSEVFAWLVGSCCTAPWLWLGRVGSFAFISLAPKKYLLKPAYVIPQCPPLPW